MDRKKDKSSTFKSIRVKGICPYPKREKEEMGPKIQGNHHGSVL
jgi:hypothetical protein